MEITERGNESAYWFCSIKKLNKRDNNMYIGRTPYKAIKVFICQGKAIYDLNDLILKFLKSIYKPYDKIYFKGYFWLGTSRE